MIWLPSKACNPLSMTSQGITYRFSSLWIPKTHCVIHTSRCQSLSIRRPCDIQHPILVALDWNNQLKASYYISILFCNTDLSMYVEVFQYSNPKFVLWYRLYVMVRSTKFLQKIQTIVIDYLIQLPIVYHRG